MKQCSPWEHKMKLSELITELQKFQITEDYEVIFWSDGEQYSVDDVTTVEQQTRTVVELSGRLME